MARNPEPRFYESRKGWYVWIDGVQNHLASGPDDKPDGPTYQAACKKFWAIMEERTVEAAGLDSRIGFVLARFLEHAERFREPKTVRSYETLLSPFVRASGETRVSNLRHRHVYEFLERQSKGRTGKDGRCRKGWGDTTSAMFLNALQAALNWAAQEGVALILRNPLKGIEGTPQRSRAREALITDAQHANLISRCHSGTRAALVCLEATGARPGELLKATAADWDARLGALVYHTAAVRRRGEGKHKTAKVNERVILFEGTVLEMVEGLVKRYPSGPLFRCQSGQRMTEQRLSNNVLYLRKALGNPPITPYSYRHKFATDWLIAGKNIDVLASLLGNSPAVIRRHYAHLLAHPANLREQLESFKNSRSARANPSPPFRVVG